MIPTGGETTDPDVDLVARLALRTRWSPQEVLDTPPEVLDRVHELILEEQKQRAREQLQARLRGRRG